MARGKRLNRRYYLLFVSHGGRPVRQISVPRLVLTGMALLMVALGLGAGASGWHMQNLHRQAVRAAALKAQVQSQAAEIAGYQTQISAFAQRVDALTARLGELDALEQKIRTLANLEQSDNQAGVLSVGGAEPLADGAETDLAKDHRQLIRALHARTRLVDRELGQRQFNFEELLDALGEQRSLLAATPSIRPVDGGWISSSFGHRISPFTNRRVAHRGLDIATHPGRPIYATAAGRVTFAGNNGNMGRTIIINHGYGITTYYAHCQKLLKKKGERVKRGDVIAKVGNTGRSTGPHVHYEVRLNGVPVNPKKYIQNL